MKPTRTHNSGTTVRPARRGSVLILSVSILVLLALMGTAWVAAVRLDRQQVMGRGGSVGLSSGGGSADETAIQAALAATEQFARQALVDDIAKLGYRNPSVPREDSEWYDYHLSSRLPVEESTAPGGVKWPAIYLHAPGGVPQKFVDPFGINAGTAGPREYPSTGTPTLADYEQIRKDAWPTAIAFTPDDPAPATPRHRVYPALVIDDMGTRRVILAADADGDGIADAGLFDLGITDSDGNRLFGAIRIVDNSAAINVNTAFRRDGDFVFAADPATDAPTLPNLGLFRSNVGLLELMASSANDRTRLKAYKFSNANNAAAAVFGDSGSRPDIQFISTGDALEMQLARRTGNAGRLANGVSFQAFAVTDTAANAYRMGMINPASVPTQLEQRLFDTDYRYAPNFPIGTGIFNRSKMFRYFPPLIGDSMSAMPFSGSVGYGTSANGVRYWYNWSYEFDATARNSYLQGTWGIPPASVPDNPVRSLLVTSNPLSEAIPSYFRDRLEWTSTPSPAYRFGDIVSYTASGHPERKYVALRNNPAGPPPTPPNTNTNVVADNDNWQLMPWTKQPVKTSINTASFGELYLAFWSVMTGDQFAGPNAVPQYGATPTDADAFKSTLRGHTVPYVTGAPSPDPMEGYDVQLIRAALAAVNAIDMRDADDDITSKVIRLSTGEYVTVFGTERQVVIQEVFVHVDESGNRYVAVELYNPNPDADVSLENWEIAWMPRNTNTHTLTSVYTFGNVTIPANGHVLLHNAGSRPTVDAPPAPTTDVVDVADLAEVLQGEMVIVRPRRADGAPTSGVNESNPALKAPVDQYDFSGMNFSNADAGTSRRYHYYRHDGWASIYPGEYDPTVAAGSPRHIPTEELEPVLGTAESTDADNWPVPGPGPTPDVATFPRLVIQLNNPGIARVNPISGSAPYHFPFGGFARNGDILAVPYIGAYRVHDDLNSVNTIEMNAVSMDAYYSDDSNPLDISDNNHIGRFCPVGDPLSSSGDYSSNPNNHRRAWAMDLFDYLTVQTPSDDYLPNISPREYLVDGGSAPEPEAVKNGSASAANRGNEDLEPVHGLININTASWKVLSMLPLVVDPNTGRVVDVTVNENLAKAIVAYRDANGPFKSIFELNKVPGFRTMNGLVPGSTNPGFALGDITPDLQSFPAVGGAQVNSQAADLADDFEYDFFQMTRLSNLITTRSDSYTVYCVVQAWELPTPGGPVPNDTARPILKGERRSAFIIDRTSLYPGNTDTADLTEIAVPSN